jgi:DNA uptake protein ComE-like DNA-binding protein
MLLSVVVITVLHTAQMDLLVEKNYGDRIQAHYLALAGIEKARALLYHDAQDRRRSRKNHTGNFYDDPGQFREIAFSRGTYSLIRRGRSDEGGGIIYGVSDEESRLNVNSASADELSRLPNMTRPVSEAIVNWRSGGNTAAGEADYYAGLQPPYQPRLGPIQTVRELLMVRGVEAEDLLGRDRHLNGLLAAGENGGYAMPDSVDTEDLGWAGILTVNSSVQDVNAAGQDRVNIQTADENTLGSLRGLTPQMAHAITAYRGQHPFQSIVDLLDVTPPRDQSGLGGDQSGQPVITDDLFVDLADDITTGGGDALPGVINVNTASLDVLICLPGVSRELAQAIISRRQSSGYFNNIGELLNVSSLSRDILKQMAPLICTRSETYRLLGEGRIKSTGARQRIEATIHIGLNSQQILSWREDNL